MKTEIINCTGKGENPEGIRCAAKILKSGGLVGMPTETVYGLAANALDAGAVKKIFTAKGRPQDNPLIAHVADASWLETYALRIPDKAYELIDRFWPGPLTIILKKNPVIPDIVSAGLDTEAFRCPSHPVAHALIVEAGVPIAAPSANTSGKPSPTTATDVLADMDGKIEAVVDGGKCGVGVESTVITLCTDVPRLLRPGGVTYEQLCSVLGNVDIDPSILNKVKIVGTAAAPGMKYKHYSPDAEVVLLKGGLEKAVSYVNAHAGPGVAALCFEGEEKLFSVPCVTYGRAGDGESQAAGLFRALRHLDEIGAEKAFARFPETTGVGLAVYNRMLRASAFHIVEL